ncbi:asparaginase-domain-containing protein [Suillus paluster]|uniref:asparaginase-domain-containing protein n=1 Tax=Suillus paluster TaxID=48578 RepID=UPI001B87461F|nr:asparaginase-domain-containing protein [Suillus paluster]KAG1725009.1 asparaginase-domain-containing protein [Suillus paluster]
MEPRSDEARVLVIYAGGTIGMLISSRLSRGYIPEPHFLTDILRNQQRFHDPLQGSFSNAAYTKRTRYAILEFIILTRTDWTRIAAEIELNYTSLDVFAVLNGTDIMSYSSSAFSFLFEDFGKTVWVLQSDIIMSAPSIPRSPLLKRYRFSLQKHPPRSTQQRTTCAKSFMELVANGAAPLVTLRIGKHRYSQSDKNNEDQGETRWAKMPAYRRMIPVPKAMDHFLTPDDHSKEQRSHQPPIEGIRAIAIALHRRRGGGCANNRTIARDEHQQANGMMQARGK